MQLRRRRTQDRRYRFDREFGDDRWIGRALATKERVLLTELAFTDLSCDDLRALLDFKLEGVAPLRDVVAHVHGPKDPNGAVLVEALPPGEPLYRRRVAPERRLEVALELARTTERALDANIALPGFRPDLIIVGDTVTIVPRSDLFLRHRSKRFIYMVEEWSYDRGLRNLYDPASPLGSLETLVFQLGLAIGWIWAQRHPFADKLARAEHDSIDQLLYAGERHDPWPGPPEVDELLVEIFRYQPSRRPGIDQVLGVLERVRVGRSTI